MTWSVIRRYATSAAPATNSIKPSAKPVVAFNDVFSDLETRFFRYKLNRTNRNLVFRPRRAKELESRKHAVLFQGEPLRPLEFRGIPGQASLYQLINGISTVEDYQKAKQVVNDYATYARDNLRPKHLALLARQAAFLGQLRDALELFNHTNLRDITTNSRTIAKEILRLRAAGALANTKGLVSPLNYAQSVLKAYQSAVALDKTARMSAGSTLAAVCGLSYSYKAISAIESSSEATKKVQADILTQLKSCVDKFAEQQSTMQAVLDKRAYSNFNKLAMLVDVRLGIKGLNAAEEYGIKNEKIDLNKLRLLARSCKTTLPKDSFDNYVAKVCESFPQEAASRKKLSEGSEKGEAEEELA